MAQFSLSELLPNLSPVEIVDIGAAYSEKPVYEPLLAGGRARLTGFEPDRAACAALAQRFGPPHRFFPAFVGSGAKATFHETNWGLTGSLFEPNTPLLEKFQNLAEVVTPKAQWPVDTTRLDDVAGIDAMDFLKIDVQGAELMIFENAPRLMSRCLVVHTEVEFVELYRGQPLFAEVDTCLRRLGFQFHTFAGLAGRPFKPLARDNNPNNPIRQYLWADAIYVRDWMRLDALDGDRLGKYALLAHDVLQSFDLCHLLLRELDRRTPPAGAPPGAPLAERYLRRLLAGAPPPRT